MDVRTLRLCWFAVAILSVLLGLLFLTGGPGTGMDGRLLLDAGDALRGGGPLYSDPKFLYTPLAALIAAGPSVLPREVALDAWVLAEVAILVGTVWLIASPLDRPLRIVAVLGVLVSLWALWDLWLANVTIAIVAALAVGIRGADRPTRGVALGIAIAIAPKPILLPALIWMAFFRPRTFVGTAVTVGVATGLGVILLGVGAYGDWLSTLGRATTLYTQAFGGNWGLSAFGGGVYVVVAAVDMVVLLGLCIAGDESTALVLALLGSLIVAPYVGEYTVLVAMLALPIVMARWPRGALVLGLVSPLAFGLAPAASAVVVSGLVALRGRAPRRLQGLDARAANA